MLVFRKILRTYLMHDPLLDVKGLVIVLSRYSGKVKNISNSIFYGFQLTAHHQDFRLPCLFNFAK